MPSKHRSAEARLANHKQKQISTWVTVDLLARLDEKLARQWLDNHDRPRPSRRLTLWNPQPGAQTRPKSPQAGPRHLDRPRTNGPPGYRWKR